MVGGKRRSRAVGVIILREGVCDMRPLHYTYANATNTHRIYDC
jgi:hypothetical protein